VGVWAAIILVATSVPLTEAALRISPFPGLDKVVHGALYAVLGWLVGATLCVSGRCNARVLGIALVTIALFAAADEAHQAWLPGRVPMVSDWMADVIGASIGLIMGTVTWRGRGGEDRVRDGNTE
jgi:VanZ family protein